MNRLRNIPRIAPSDYTTDAAAWTVTQSEARLKWFGVQQARSFARAGRRLMASDAAASLAARYGENIIEAVCDAAAPTTLQLFTGAKPLRVSLDGRELALNFNQTEAMVSLSVPAGRHQLRLELR